MRLPAGPAIARRFLTIEMRFSRHAWWLYLSVMALIAVAYLAGPLNAGPVFNVIGFSAVHRDRGRGAHAQARRSIAVVSDRARPGFLRRGRRARVQLHGVLRRGAAVPLGRRPGLPGGLPLTVAGLLLLIRRRNPGRDWAGLVDAMIVTIGLALLSWVFLIAPYANDATLHLEPSWSRSPTRSETS